MQGVFVPLVTPIDSRGQLDPVGLRQLLDHLAAGGIQGLFLLGTTGEYASLGAEQRQALVEQTVDWNRSHGLRLFAGVSDNCLAGVLEAARQYALAGVEGVFAHPPCIYPMDEEAIEAWFLELADRSPLPLLLYNIPLTTHISIPEAVVLRLSHHPNIVGLKDSERDAERMRRLLGSLRDCGDFCYLSGCGALIGDALLEGADGCVPGTGNLTPADFVAIMDAARAGDGDGVRLLQHKTQQTSLHYQEGRTLARNLPVLKAMLETLGICPRHVLPPLIEYDGALPPETLMFLKTLGTPTQPVTN